jgi:membrane-associated phospholipid phosphatase
MGIVALVAGISPKLPLLKFLNRWYPFSFVPLFFAVLQYLIPPLRGTNLDPQLIRLDFFLLGEHPTIWFEKFYSPFVTELLQLSYLTFYFLPLLILIPLYNRGDLQKFDRFSLAVLSTFYLSYFGYLIFPALGPRYYLAHLHSTPLHGTGIYYAVKNALNGLENIQWDAFPSGHVAIAMIFSHFAFRYFRRIFYFTLPVIALLFISTVYLRYHYVIDIFAGIAIYFIVVVIDRSMNTE